MTSQQQLDIAVRGLFALVFLFSVFVVYQQILIKRLRHRLAAQVANVVVIRNGATPTS